MSSPTFRSPFFMVPKTPPFWGSQSMYDVVEQVSCQASLPQIAESRTGSQLRNPDRPGDPASHRGGPGLFDLSQAFAFGFEGRRMAHAWQRHASAGSSIVFLRTPRPSDEAAEVNVWKEMMF